MNLLALLSLFTDLNDRFPYTLSSCTLQLVKPLPFVFWQSLSVQTFGNNPPPRTCFHKLVNFQIDFPKIFDYQISLPIRLQKLETYKIVYISGVLIASTLSFLSLSYHGCAQWDTRTEVPLLEEKVLQNYAKFIWSVKAPPGYALLACLAFALPTLVLVSLVRTGLKMPEIGVSARIHLSLN